MSQQKAFNVSPYYDDFDDGKGFHQILFRPGVSVQSRELTSLQTILRDQVKKFGDHVFQQGSIVIPGNSFYDFNATAITLQPNFAGAPIQLTSFQDKIIVGLNSSVEAIVRKVIEESNVIIVDYVTAGDNGEAGFEENEEIFLKENISVRATISNENAFNNCSLAFVNEGVYYINGSFVKVKKQTVVVDAASNIPSAHVLLKINESIVTADDDQSLLDPAQGEPNFAAPGADRLKIELELTTLPLGSTIGSDFVEIMRFDQGVLVFHAKNPKYSELEKSLARRTYDESGDYLVEGFTPTIIEHLRADRVYGAYFAPEGDKNKFVLELTPGKAYIKGFEKEIISKTQISAPKARTPEHIKNKDSGVVPSYGQVIHITNLVKLPNTFNHEQVFFFNDSDAANGSATQIGSAKAYAIEYKEGQAIFSLYIYDAVFTGSNTIENVGGIRFTGSGSATVLQKLSVPNTSGSYTVNETVNFGSRTAKIAYHDILSSVVYIYKVGTSSVTPKLGDNILGVTSGVSGIIREKSIIVNRGNADAPIVEIPMAPLARIRNAIGNPDIIYRAYKYLTIATNSSGNGSVTIDNGRIDALTQGALIASWSGGMVNLNLFSINPAGTTLTISGGPASTTIQIQVSVTKTGTAEKTKTLQTHVESGITLDGTVVKFKKLARADIYRLVSIVSSTDGDVTNSFTLDDGQRNYFYDLGTVTLNSNVVPGGTLTITYQFFNHSSSGDYFTVDSYRNSGIAPSTDLDFIGNVPSFYSKSSSKFYDLKSCYDFRKIIGQVGDSLVNDSKISASVDYYVGRTDVYGISTSGDIVYIQGIPEEVPETPKVPNDTLVLGSFNIPAWTADIRAIRPRRERVQRYTMRDINRLASRLDNLEEYVTLNALESDATKMNIVDPVTGLNRFKTGILVDNFSNPDIISDYFDETFAAEYEDDVLKPAKEWVATGFTLDNTSTNYRLTGSVVTLPYTDFAVVRQPFSTKITNVNPFLVISWVGNMTLSPSSDSWIETENLPAIINTVNREVVITRTLNDRLHPIHDGRIASIIETVTASSVIPSPTTGKPIQTPAVTVATNVLAKDEFYWRIHGFDRIYGA
jgi:hypothetical protein